MRLLVALLFVLLPVLPSAACEYELAPRVYRDGQVLRLNVDKVYVERLSAYFDFERDGGWSEVWIYSKPNGLLLDAKLDLPGPDWLYLTLEATSDKIRITTRHVGLMAAVKSENDSQYATLEDAFASKYGETLYALFARLNLPPVIDAWVAQRLRWPGNPDKAAVRKGCRLLLQITSSDATVRDKAGSELRKDRAVLAHLRLAAKQLGDLSPEQAAIVEAALKVYDDAELDDSELCGLVGTPP